MSIHTVTKCSVRIIGSEMGHAGWIENKVLEIGEGFKSRAEAEAWGKAAMERLKSPTVSPSRYMIEKPY